ncbi:MAG: tRNA (guanosine(37)-N1)-methyltransferase TrmD [Bacillota bacterium]|nr:tRNA (guanosine(37)-N1)-methyltransferase TrmD [Bacillota bacterium]
MNIQVLTLFPEVIESYVNTSIIKRAREKNIVSIEAVNFRDYAENKHHSVDDSPFGGGAGMVLTPQPIASALKELDYKNKKVIYLTPKGEALNQDLASDLSKESDLILLCGHYEGLDQRIIDNYVDLEVSIGDYVLSGGELGALVMIDAVTRLIPGTLTEESLTEESFSNHLLEYPQYTRPRDFEGHIVPDVLLSGNHKNIEQYRMTESIKLTLSRRKDLISEGIENEYFSDRIVKLIKQLKKNLL